MTKTLSEELCEICGIKPKIIQDNEDYHIEALPDFTKPENFVKLLEIMTDETIKEKLSRIVRLLKVESGDFIYDKKQAIRKADWNWK